MEPQFTPGPWTWIEDGILGEETPVLLSAPAGATPAAAVRSASGV